MGRRVSTTLAWLGLALLTTACATSQEWSEWSQHPSHFASGEHAFFSMRNRSGTEVRVTRADIDGARTEGWWGQPVTVSSEAIIQR
jgi:hypothetical protein